MRSTPEAVPFRRMFLFGWCHDINWLSYMLQLLGFPCSFLAAGNLDKGDISDRWKKVGNWETSIINWDQLGLCTYVLIDLWLEAVAHALKSLHWCLQER